MILDQLKAFHGRIEDKLIPAHHKEQPVRWILDIGPNGQFLNLIESGPTKKKQVELQTPYAKRTGSAPPPFLLVDKPAYVLGIPDPGKKGAEEKAKLSHQAYLDLLNQCQEAIEETILDTFVVFLQTPDAVERARTHENVPAMKASDLIVPRVAGNYPHQQPAVRRFWQELKDREANEKSVIENECLLCGEHKPVARTHPIELLVGPDRVGLITGNKPSFLSFGLKQSEIAPLCQTCARTYGEALRYLLKTDKHHLRVSDVTWLFWTHDETDFPFLNLITNPDERHIEHLLKSPWTAQRLDVDANQFYALVVSSNTSRMVIRSWLTISVPQVQENLAGYFQRQGITDLSGETRYYGILSLASALVRDLKDLPPQVAPALLEHAITGQPLPLYLLNLAVQRARADEHPVTRNRAALIKLVLLAQLNPQEKHMANEHLNPDHPNPAYHCGRLLAVLDDIQRKAISPKATLVDRFYGAASATPASVFGVLMRKTQAHLSKLRKSSPGLHHYFEQRLGEIADRLQEFPRTLTMQDQGLFALGYYQQKNYRPAKDNNDQS